LAALLCVDAVCLFDEDTPLEMIKALRPDVLVKGGDYTKDKIVGAADVEKNGGEIVIIPFVEGYSTSNLISKIRSL
jgi:D-glycero-beta-D-manno-heptose 1-phosphate adenylyltransferase